MYTTLRHAILASSWAFSAIHLADAASDRPNIVFILTDDQDNHMGTLDHMQSLQKHLVHQGTTFERHYCHSKYCHFLFFTKLREFYRDGFTRS
jgi:hypothetical protein